jgi:hypothetical protein
VRLTLSMPGFVPNSAWAPRSPTRTTYDKIHAVILSRIDRSARFGAQPPATCDLGSDSGLTIAARQARDRWVTGRDRSDWDYKGTRNAPAEGLRRLAPSHRLRIRAAHRSLAASPQALRRRLPARPGIPDDSDLPQSH